MELKIKVRRELNRFRATKDSEYRCNYIALRREYLNLIRSKKETERLKNQHKLLHALNTNDSKSFWALIKSKKEV